MLKIIDVDLVAAYTLELTFNDGYRGRVNLQNYFRQPPFSEVSDFQRFALTVNGALSWSGNEISAIALRSLCADTGRHTTNHNMQDIEAVIKQASWDSMQEGRPDILQAAIRAYVEQFGHSAVIEKAGIKSRTSAYKSLKPETTPSFSTLVQLGHAVIALAKESEYQSV